jgi:outer membrane protein assembly factor BamA
LPTGKTYKLLLYACCTCLLLWVSGCKVSKNFTEGQTLLKSNKVKFVSDQNKKIKQSGAADLAKVAAQRPNKKVFGFLPFKLWLYTAANRKKENKIKWWIKNKVGEPPVIYDSELADKSDKLLTNYLQNQGYLYAQVTHTATTKKKKTSVLYTVNKGLPFTIGDVEFPSAPFLTDSITQAHKKQTKFKKGDKFDVSTLKAERERIELDLKNSGYYFFSKEYIAFDLDTNKQPQVVNVRIRINQPTDSIKHEQYRINEIYVTGDFGIELTEGTVKRDTVKINEFYFANQKKVVVPAVIQDAIFIAHDQLYTKSNYTKTVRTLSNLGAYKFVTVEYVRAPNMDNYLNCVINLTPAKKQTISGEVGANVNYEGYFGVSGALSYKNRNQTHHSDLFVLDFTSGLQFQFARNQPVKVMTTEFSASASYYFNKFLFPFSKRYNQKLKDKSPKTRLSIRYNYEERYDFDTAGQRSFFYTLHGFNASFGYEWNTNQFKRHILTPINFTLFLIPKRGSAFEERLNANPTLKSSYQEQVIFGPSYTFIYSNQQTKNDRKYMYFRTTLETAGNILFAGYSLANIGKTKQLPYTIFNKDFSQFVRGDFDIRGYYRLTNHGSLAGRAYFGIAVPYGNSSAIPFVKQFFSGGPNSLRGFLVREVGPGGYVDSTKNNNTGFFNQTGDMKMEANFELRFDIYRWLKGAIFTDIGNVWLVKRDTERPLANFDFTRFWREFAIDVGAGIRLDFNYFVVRVDYGIGIRDPNRNSTNKWYINPSSPGRLQLAIGYPF